MKMLVISLCFMFGLVLVSAQQPDLDEDWEKYKMDFNKSYNPDEDAWRRSIWEKDVEFVTEHNKQADEGLYSYTLDINMFSDMTEDEFSATHTGILPMDVSEFISTNESLVAPPQNAQLPDFVDWRTKGVVTPAKTQGYCGSCWAFTAIGALESQHAIKTGQLVLLSEQNLMDCDRRSHGCSGGYIQSAYDYIIANRGVATAESYSYKGRRNQCRYNPKQKGATMSKYEIVYPRGDESILQYAVAHLGPVAGHMHAEELPELKSYRGGIFSSRKCMNKQLDHGVLIVGYGTENGRDYWIIKNSWGKNWGVEGYLYLERNTNMCGIATLGFVPII